MASLRAIATVGGYTFVSRVLGFVREMLITSILGAGPVLDAFIVAFKLPNFFRRLFAEGAFNAAFVPLFSGIYAREGKSAGLRFARQIFSLLLMVLLFLVALVEIFTPYLMCVIAPGFGATPERLQLAIDFTRITFPYILFISLSALISGLLNSVNRFAAASAAPLILNITMILSLFLLTGFVETLGHALSWGVPVAGVGQFAWLSWAQNKAALRLDWTVPRLTPEVKTFLKKMAPGALGAGVFQINLFIDLMMGSFLPVGSLTYLYIADRINQLPLSVIGISISTAFLPSLSKLMSLDQQKQAIGLQNRVLELGLILALPATLALGVLSHPIVDVLFGRGAFTSRDVASTAHVLVLFVLGLPAYILTKILSTIFFAHQDTKTPLRGAVLGVSINLILNLLLIRPLGVLGVAFATAAAAWVNAIALGYVLFLRGWLKLDAQLKKAFLSTLCAGLVMVGGLKGIEFIVQPLLEGFTSSKVCALVLLISGGGGLFFFMAYALKIVRLRDIKSLGKDTPTLS